MIIRLHSAPGVVVSVGLMCAVRTGRSLLRRLCWTLSLLLTVGFYASPAAAQNPKLVMEEFMVPAKDPGLQLYVRNKRPEGMTQFSPEKTVVYVHGATYPSETAFDLPLAGQSWMDYIPAKQLVMFGEGTHTIIMEKNRMQLFNAVQNFLEEKLNGG